MKPTLFIVAGGSGGHILPALNLGQQWQHKHENGTIIFFTGNAELEKKILKSHQNLTVNYCSLAKFSLRRWWKIPLIVIQMLLIFITTLCKALWFRPQMVISTGGILAVPVCLAAWVAQCPIELYELNVIPGKAAQFLFGLASTIRTPFKQTAQYCRWGRFDFSSKCKSTQYPLRFSVHKKNSSKDDIFLRINGLLEQRSFKDHFSHTRKTLFIVGGSQGSKFLNELIKVYITQNTGLLDKIQIIHQTGSFEEISWDAWYQQHHVPALTFRYDEHIEEYYDIADLIVCRAGAGTLFEIAYFKKPCVVVPLVASTTDHQVFNAKAMAEQYPGQFTVLEQGQLKQSPELFSHSMNILMF